MIFIRANIKINFKDVIINDCLITRVNSVKYIDHKLNCIDHVTHIKNKISADIGIMYKSKSVLNTDSLLTI